MSDTGLSIVKDGGIATVVLEKLRLDSRLTYMLGCTFADLEDDPEAAAVVLTGRKNVFLSGADLHELMALRSREEAVGHLELAAAAWKPIRDFSKPLVAAINGHCLGGGLELALWADCRVCVDEVRNIEGEAVPFLGFPEVALGVVPPLGGVQRLARLVGPARAKALLFTGEPIVAPRALEIGLVDRVVAADRLLPEARRLVGAMLANSSRAVREVKALVERSFVVSGLDAGLELEREAFARCCEAPDKNERIRAFLEGAREPVAAGGSR